MLGQQLAVWPVRIYEELGLIKIIGFECLINTHTQRHKTQTQAQAQAQTHTFVQLYFLCIPEVVGVVILHQLSRPYVWPFHPRARGPPSAGCSEPTHRFKLTGSPFQPAGSSLLADLPQPPVLLWRLLLDCCPLSPSARPSRTHLGDRSQG